MGSEMCIRDREYARINESGIARAIILPTYRDNPKSWDTIWDTFTRYAYVDEETAVSGSGVGIWNRDGLNLSMQQLINVSDGTINFDKITLDPLKRTGTLDVYALK